MSVDIPWLLVGSLVLSSSVVGALLSRWLDSASARAESVREGYSRATEAMVGWYQFPDRIRRRAGDDPEELRRLEQLGDDLQGDLARAYAWVHSESTAMGWLYEQCLTMIRRHVRFEAPHAWATAPASSPERMNRDRLPATRSEKEDITPVEWVIARTFTSALRFRLGWRRRLVPAALARVLLRQDPNVLARIEKAEQAWRDYETARAFESNGSRHNPKAEQR